VSGYRLYVVPPAWDELQRLPGNIKYRVRKAIDDLIGEPYPPASKPLELADGNTIALFRLRMDNWRIVYAVDTDAHLIRVVAVRKRPPYDYQDLAALLEDTL
jgi:mRNA-degrading endonuclease RelE of RelBE toxin-antitoxin system